MPKKKIAFINPFLNEYVYLCLHNVTDAQKKRLSSASLRVLSTSTRAKNFAVHATDDEKKKMLSEMGYQWATIIMPKGVKSVTELKRMMDKVNEGRASLGVEHLIKEQIFITTDKQVMFMLGIAAQTIAHNNYFLNLDLFKIGHAVKRWQKRVDEINNNDAKDAMQDADLIDNLIIKSIDVYSYAMGLLGITEMELKVLQYFCINRHLYIEKQKISDKFKGVIGGIGITSALRRLFAGNYIRKHLNSRPARYTITGSGIDLVSKFRNRVISEIA